MIARALWENASHLNIESPDDSTRTSLDLTPYHTKEAPLLLQLGFPTRDDTCFARLYPTKDT